MGYYYRSDKESPFHEFLTQPEHIHVVCDAEVASDLVSLDINGTDYYNNLSFVCKVAEAGVVVIEKFAAEFKIQFVTKLRNSLFDMLRLYSEIFVVVKSVFHNGMQS